MNTQTLSFRDMLSTGWQLFKKHWLFILQAGVVTIVIYSIFQALQGVTERTLLLGFVVSIVSLLISIMITLGWAQVLLGFVRDHAVSWKTFQTKPSVWLRYVKTYLWFIGYTVVFSILTVLPGAILATAGFFADIYWLLVVGVVLASAALVITFIYFSIKYQFINLAVIEHSDLSSRDIFKKAGSITQGHLVKLFLFGVVIGLVNLLGLIVIGLGLIVSIPVTKIAQVKMYTYLKEFKN